MNPKKLKENISDNKHHLENLVTSNPKTINLLMKNNMNYACIYAISDKDDSEILYVGQSESISVRLRHHLNGINSSDLKQKTNLDANELKWFKVRFRRMADERKRKLFESYIIGELKPKLNF